jgi:hypothetical protein
MDSDQPERFRYQPKYCAFLRKHVWAILTPQADGSWRIVNCLDKDEGCFHLDCVFTTDHGEWPYKASPADQPESTPKREPSV